MQSSGDLLDWDSSGRDALRADFGDAAGSADGDVALRTARKSGNPGWATKFLGKIKRRAPVRVLGFPQDGMDGLGFPGGAAFVDFGMGEHSQPVPST